MAHLDKSLYANAQIPSARKQEMDNASYITKNTHTQKIQICMYDL